MIKDHDTSFDQDLLDLFSKLIEDESEKLVLQLIFANNDTEKILDELVKTLEHEQND